MHDPVCYHQAVVGISSTTYIQRFNTHITADKILISLGSNDGNPLETRKSLEALRSNVNGSVTWLLSHNNPIAGRVAKEIAMRYGDRVIDIFPVVSRDGVHPTTNGYRKIAREWRQ